MYERRLTIKRRNDESQTTLRNNYMAFMFDEIRYEINGVEIDRNKTVGITNTTKNYISLTYDKLSLIMWLQDGTLYRPYWKNTLSTLHLVTQVDISRSILVTYFEKDRMTFVSICIIKWKAPFNFCRSTRCWVFAGITNAHHELILIRARNNNNCLMGKPTTKRKLIYSKWQMPHVMLNEINWWDKLFLVQVLKSGQYLSMSFLS